MTLLQMMGFVHKRVEIKVGNGESAGDYLLLSKM